MRKQFEPGLKQPNRKWAARLTERARVPLWQVIADYPTTPAAKQAREMLDPLNGDEPASTQPG